MNSDDGYTFQIGGYVNFNNPQWAFVIPLATLRRPRRRYRRRRRAKRRQRRGW